MPHPKLVVLGNACRDIIYRLDRLPRPGETLIARDVAVDLGGKGLNQAIAAQRAGANVRLIAAVGDDVTAGQIRAALRDEGIDDRDLIASAGVSDESLLLIDAEGENIIMSNTQKAHGLGPAQVETALAGALDGAHLLLVQGNLSRESTFHALTLARALGAKIAVNPSPSQAWFKLMRQVDVIVANRGEADDLGQLQSDIAVVTLGEKGCRLIPKQGPYIDVPAPKVCSVSAGGAGDVFAGTFIAEFLSGGKALSAARLAVRAASDKATRPGTLSAFPTREAIDSWRRELPPA